MKNITDSISGISSVRALIAKDLPNQNPFVAGDSPECDYYETEDFWELDRYERYYKGVQHDDKKFNWSGTAYVHDPKEKSIQNQSGIDGPASGRRVPWYLRRPFIREQLCPVIVDRFSDTVFSEQNRPNYVEFDNRLAPFFNKITEKVNLWARMLTARDMAGASGTVAVGLVMRRGIPQIQIINAKFCHPTFADDDKESGILTALEIMYSYTVNQDVFDRMLNRIVRKPVQKLYRRILTPNYDIVMTAVIPEDAKKKPEWVVTSAIETGLKFVPFVWIQNDANPESEYGYPDCDQQLDNFDALDGIMSQSFRGTLYNSDPTLVAFLASDKESPATVETGSGTAFIADPTLKEDLKLMEMNGSGPKTGLEVEERIRKIILRDTRCVLPEELVNANTAAEIMARLQAMINRVQRLRSQWREPLIQLMVFMIGILKAEVPGMDGKKLGETLPWLKGIELPKDEDSFELSWPALSELDESKILAKVTAYVAAIEGGVISQETAVGKLAADLGVNNPLEEIGRIKGERAEKMADVATSVARRIITNRQGKVNTDDVGGSTRQPS